MERSRRCPTDRPGLPTGRESMGAGGGSRGCMNGADPKKDVQNWATGEEPATGPQLSYLQTLAPSESGESGPENP
ncbi:DUF3072 domain-containing protein [Streptomyces sp. ICN988]|uniref:DUF3072 domain-containing protein n=1 Tax=Streptomyces sp. ICN988 TaxID=2983765 RepID=UPI0029623C8B|nr:DUF3072 domain-containing protein [Streptomyces sp. ICN988]